MRAFLALTLLLVPLAALAQEQGGEKEKETQKEATPPVQTVEPPKPAETPKPTPKPKKGGLSLKTTGGGPEAVGGNGEKVLGPLGKGLNFSGGWSLTGRSNSVSGSAQARSWYDFQNNNSYLTARPLGPLQQNLDVSVQGKLLGVFDVSASLTNDRFRANQQQVVGLNYDSKKGTRVSLGDVNASLSGNELVSFSRNLQGVYFSRDLNKSGMKLTSVASITRALTRRGNLQGNGTTGPYFLNAQQLMQGTETVLLNGQKLVPGEDYRLDYFTGQLDLLKSRILNPQDTIEYTYEAQSFNTRAGVLTGFRLDLPQSGGNTFGFTMLNQRSGAGGVRGAARKVTDYFAVAGDINYRYFLRAPVLAGTPVVVHYQNRPLVEGADKDYIYNRTLNYVQLRIALPPDTSFTGISSLGVDYTPTQQSGTTGDKTVLGFDAGVKLPGRGRLSLQAGQSGGMSGKPGGTGLTLTSTFGSPEGAKRSWNFTTSLRAIQPGFSAIDSVSSAFLRAERTVTTGFNYNPGGIWKADIRLSQGRQGNSALALGGASATPASLTWAGDKNLSIGFDIAPKGSGKTPLPEFTLRHDNRTQSLDGSSAGTSGGATRSSFKNDALTFRWTPVQGGALSLDGTLGRSESRGRSVFASGYTDTVGTGFGGNTGTVLDSYRSGLYGGSSTNAASTNANLNVRYSPLARLALTGSIGTSKSKYLATSAGDTGTSGNGSTQTDIGLGLRYELSRALSLEWTASGGANGQSLAGFYTQAGSAATGQKTRNQNLSVHFTPSSGIDVTLNHRRQLSLIPGYDNSENLSTDLAASATITPTFMLNAQVMQQNNTYVSGSGRSNNLSYALTSQHGPFGKLSFTTSLTRSAFGFGGGTLSTGGLGGSVGGVVGGGGTGSGLGGGGFGDGAMTTLGLQASYDLSGTSLFLRYANTNQLPGTPSSSGTGPTDTLGGYHSSSNFRDNDLQLGAQWKLTELLGATFSTRLAQRRDRDDARYSYRARTFNFDLGLRF